MAFNPDKFKTPNKGLSAPPTLGDADDALLDSTTMTSPTTQSRSAPVAARQERPVSVPTGRPVLAKSASKKGRYTRADGVDMEQMNLNVPSALAREFRISAAIEGIGLGELLALCYDAWKEKHKQ